MKIAALRQAVLVRMPALDLGTLCFLPEMLQFLSRFPGQVKVNLASAPYFLALSWQVVPLLLELPGDADVLAKVKRSLRKAMEVNHPLRAYE